MPDVQQELALAEEVSTAIRLLQHGLGALQRIDGANDFCHVPILTIGSGFERLMKVVLCPDTLRERGAFPTSGPAYRGRTGHDLEYLLGEVVSRCLTPAYCAGRTGLATDRVYLTEDNVFRSVLGILSRFAQAARYHHLDVILGKEPDTSSPEQEWARVEIDLLANHPHGLKMLEKPNGLREAYAFLVPTMVSNFERLARALCRLFSLGDLGPLAKRQTGTIQPFLRLMDDDLGKTAYG